MTRGQETLDIGLVAAQAAVELGLAEAIPQVARLIVRHDANAFRLLWLWTLTKARCRNRDW